LINLTISVFKLIQVDVFGREWEQFKIKRPRRKRKLPVILSVGLEIEKQISVTQNIKYRAIIDMAYSAGLIRQEVQLIRPVNIDSALMQVKVILEIWKTCASLV